MHTLKREDRLEIEWSKTIGFYVTTGWGGGKHAPPDGTPFQTHILPVTPAPETPSLRRATVQGLKLCTLGLCSLWVASTDCCHCLGSRWGSVLWVTEQGQ